MHRYNYEIQKIGTNFNVLCGQSTAFPFYWPLVFGTPDIELMDLEPYGHSDSD